MIQNDSKVQTRNFETSSQHASTSFITDTNNASNPLPDTFGVVIQTEVKLETACELSGLQENHDFGGPRPNEKSFKTKPKPRSKILKNSDRSFRDVTGGNTGRDEVGGVTKCALSFNKDVHSNPLDIFPSVSTGPQLQTAQSFDIVQTTSEDCKDIICVGRLAKPLFSIALDPSILDLSTDDDATESSTDSIHPDSSKRCDSCTFEDPCKPCKARILSEPIQPVEIESFESFSATASSPHSQTSFKAVSFGPTESLIIPHDSSYSSIGRRTLLNEGILYPVDDLSSVDLPPVIYEATSVKDLSHSFLTGFFGAICVNIVLAVYTFCLWLSIAITANLYFSREDKESNFSLASCISLLILIILYLVYCGMFICTAGCIPCWQPSRRGTGKCCGFAFRGGHLVKDNIHRALRKDTISGTEVLPVIRAMALAKPRVVISVGAYHYIRGDGDHDSVDHGERKRKKYTFSGEKDIDVEDFALASISPEIFYEALRGMCSPTVRFKAHLILQKDQRRMILQVMDVLRKLHEGQDVFVEVGAFYDPGLSLSLSEKKERIVIYPPTTQSSCPEGKKEDNNSADSSRNTGVKGTNGYGRADHQEREKELRFTKHGEKNSIKLASLPLSKSIEEEKRSDGKENGEVTTVSSSSVDIGEEPVVTVGIPQTCHECLELKKMKVIDGKCGESKCSCRYRTKCVRHRSSSTSETNATNRVYCTKHTHHTWRKKSTRSSSRNKDHNYITINSSTTPNTVVSKPMPMLMPVFEYSGFIHHPETIIFESRKRQHILGRFVDLVFFNRVCLWVAMYSTMYLLFVMLWRGSHEQIQYTCIKHVVLTRKIHPMIPLSPKQYQAMYTS